MAEVNLNDISSNSDGKRQTEEKQEIISQDEISYKPLKKQSFVGKALDNIGVNTDVKGAGSSIWEDVIVPAFLDVCRDAMYAAADYIFGGGQRKNRNKQKGGKNGYTNYSDKSTKKNVKKSPNQASYYIEFEERYSEDPDNPGAQNVLDDMYDVLDVRGSVSVQDMITIAKRSTSNFMLGNWGWTDLSRVYVRRTAGDKYYLDLPKPIDITEV